VDFIVAQNPDVLYLDGPATYLQGIIDARQVLERSIHHLKRIVEKTKVHTLVMDHHLTRDMRWKEKMAPVMAMARRHGIAVQTAAEMRGEENNPLEARRRQLYEEEPPS
jgi:predicted metallo-beta-lactamase superfamily hydrolase